MKGRAINLKTTDCSVALNLIKTIKLGALFGDRAYDTNSIIDYAKKLAIKTIILLKSNGKSKQNFDSDLYPLRYIVENIFWEFKCLRDIVNRYFRIFIISMFLFFICSILFNFHFFSILNPLTLSS